MTAPVFAVREIRLYERDVRLRLPFRFGVITLTEAPQVFVRARIELSDGSSHWGAAAEMLVPKWFDKDLALSNEDNFEQLRLAGKVRFFGISNFRPSLVTALQAACPMPLNQTTDFCK